MKTNKSMFLLIVLMISIGNYAQRRSVKNSSYINLGLTSGLVVNADKGFLKPGLGINTTVLIPAGREHYMFSGADYFTISGELITYPHSDESYRWMINNEIDDSFNYAKAMVGFRFATRMPAEGDSYYHYRGFKPIEGSSFEPRIGAILFDNGNLGWTCSAQWNYTRKNFQGSIYGLYGNAPRHTNVGYNQTFVIGIGLGYNISL